LNNYSYVSLSSALFYYGLVDQLLQSVTAITNTRTRQYHFQDFTFTFSKVQNDFYFGFSEKRVEGKLVKIADLEKVILDYLYLHKDTYSLNLVWEKLTQHTDEFDFAKLQRYAIRCNLTLRRATGFLLDQLGVNSNALYDAVKDRNGYSRLTSDAKNFNAKWRLYYHHRIIENQSHE
jgi:predicted transcriptional regulator of viral defense system